MEQNSLSSFEIKLFKSKRFSNDVELVQLLFHFHFEIVFSTNSYEFGISNRGFEIERGNSTQLQFEFLRRHRHC